MNPNNNKKTTEIYCTRFLTHPSSIRIFALLLLNHRWLCRRSSCVLAFAAMWATLAGAERTRRVGDVLDAVCMFLPAGAFVSGGGGNLVIIGLKERTMNAAPSRGEAHFL